MYSWHVYRKISQCRRASDVLNESFITYANEAKMKYLGVKEETLNTVGAVSEETAKQMAEGVAKRAGSNVGVGITGLAGPGGETPEKKAGLVYIGVSVNGKTKVSKYQFNGNRQKVRQMAVCRALMMVRHALVEKNFLKRIGRNKNRTNIRSNTCFLVWRYAIL